MHNEKKYSLIDKFLRNEATSDELTEIENLKQDPDFQAEFDYRKDLAAAAKIEGRKAIKAQFNEFDKHIGEVKRLIPIRVLQAIAAIGIILIGAYFLMKPSTDTLSNSQLFASNYEKMPNKLALITRGETDELDSLKMAMITYNSGNYEAALELFDKIEKQNPHLDIYRGIIALEKNKTEKAIEIFERIKSIKEHPFVEDSLWYLALSQLKTGQKELAVGNFEALANNDSYYGNKAKIMLQSLK